VEKMKTINSRLADAIRITEFEATLHLLDTDFNFFKGFAQTKARTEYLLQIAIEI
jgi:hypothetical protein